MISFSGGQYNTIILFSGGHYTIEYLMGPYNVGPNLMPTPLTPALITPVSNCAEYKKVYISAFNGNIRQKIS